MTPGDWKIVPGDITGPRGQRFGGPGGDWASYRTPDNQMVDSLNHGTCVASLAAGKLTGVARKAHLIPVKYKNIAGRSTPTAIMEAWAWVVKDVIAKNKEVSAPPPGWAVINLSSGMLVLSFEKSHDH